MSDHDRSLESAFEALRAGDAERTPEFGPMLSRARARDKRRRARVAGATLVAIAATVVFVTSRSGERPSGALAAELIASEGIWRGPTDFLLERGRDPLWESTETLRKTLSYTRQPQ